MDNYRNTAAGSVQRQKQIEDCLYENLLHNSYQNITVADLCRQVGISRKAFYNYYPNKDACFCAVLERNIQNAALTLTGQTSQLKACTDYMEYWKVQKKLLDIIVRNRLEVLLWQQNMQHVLAEERGIVDMLNTPQIKSDSDILGCYLSILLTLLIRWHSRNFDVPAEDIARKFLRLVYLPVVQAKVKDKEEQMRYFEEILEN